MYKNLAGNTIVKNKIYSILILVFFGIIYSLISFVNHYNFRTYGFDLGIYNNALYDYSFFRVNNNPIINPRFNNVLSDHLSLYHFVFAPLRFIFGTWTLLLIQIISILFGALGIKKLLVYLTNNIKLATISMIYFLSMWGVISALAFDYHDNVVATMFVPWLIRYILQKKRLKMWIWTIIILISKENMSLWLAFIFAGVGVWQRKDKEIVKLALLGSLISLLYFVLALKIIMPIFANPGKKYAHFNYSILGETKSEMLFNLFLKPRYILSLLFENHSGNTYFNGIKMELHFMVLISGGIALFYKPQFLIMLIPIYAQKLFHSSFIKWGISYQYSIEFVPILTLAFFYWIYSLDITDKKKNIFVIIGTVICILGTIYVMPNRVSKWYDSKSHNIFDKSHYTRNFNVKNVHKALELIPDNAKVSAQNLIIPHLSFREDIYMYPNINDAEYIILIPKCSSSWPLTEEEYNQNITNYRKDSTISFIVDNQDVLILKKNTK